MMRLCFIAVLIGLALNFNLYGQFSRTDNIVEQRLSELKRQVEPLYREPSKDELKLLQPEKNLFVKYATFLKQSNTGLTKLINDKGCSENAKIVVATENCLTYSMPGAGSSFSFRTQNYRISRLADITFTDNSFQASGVRLHGIFVNIGDVSIEKVDLQTKGLKFLQDIQPETDFEKSKLIDLEFTNGVKEDGFLYRRGLYLAENTTFALRSIAYAGKYLRAVGGVTYNEFEFDKRKDVIVVFRVVDKDAEGNVTILWKKLREKDAPTIKKENNELKM